MNGMFSYDSKVMSTVLRVTDAVILGVLWLVCSLPVITAGAASTAYYYAYNKAVRLKTGYAWREFFASFKSNFKQATKIWLIVLGLNTVILLDCYLSMGLMETIAIARVLIGIMLVLFGIVTMWSCLLFPYLARFENGTKETLKNAAIMMLANVFWSILLLILFAAAVLMSLQIPFFGAFAPMVYMFFANKILEHIFRKYMKPEELEREDAV